VELIIAVLILLLFAVTVGKLSGRLLGVRLGKVRGVVAGILGWFVGVLAAVAVLGERGIDGTGYDLDVETTPEIVTLIAIIIFFGVLAAMPIAIALELLTRRERPAGRRRRRWMRPVRTVRAALTPYGRLREVVGHARRANLLHLRFASRAALESPELSHRLKSVLENSGGMLVKFGQIASTRTDILPATLTDELSSLRGDVRPVPPAGVREVLESELGEPVESAFASFEWEPLAAASIGQTHRAVLKDGTPVVVKVQRPGIADIVARDAAVLRLAARQVERRVSAARSLGLRALCEELITGIQAELDYQVEAGVGARLRTQRAHDVGIAVPKVYPTLSTDRMLVMEEVKGKPVSAALTASAPVERHELARRLLASFIGQILQDGLFHADPHPGNLLMDAEGTIWMLDFGSVGQLDSVALGGLRSVAIGIATHDAAVLARATRELAGNDLSVDLRSLESDLAGSLAQLDAGGGVDPQMLMQVLRVMQKHDMRVPSSITLLARALLTLEGTLTILEPTFSLAEESRTLIEQSGSSAFGTPKEMLQREALRSLPALRTLPEHVEALAGLARAGRLTVRTDRYSGADGAKVNGWMDQLVLSVLGGFGVVASALLLIAGASAGDDRLQTIIYILGFGGLTAASVLLLRSAARALRRDFGRLD
jgi:ubiquinone biosynthesis protein